VMLLPSELAAMTGATILDHLRMLRSAYPEFDTYPPSAQIAMIDLAWTGGTRLLGFATGATGELPVAIRERRWADAARCCARAVPMDRNTSVRECFVAAEVEDDSDARRQAAEREAGAKLGAGLVAAAKAERKERRR